MNAVEVSLEVREIVQQFIIRKMSKKEAAMNLKPIIEEHAEKIYFGDGYTFTLQQKLGKRRMQAFEDLLDEIKGS